MFDKIGEFFDKRYQKRLDAMPRRRREAYERAWAWRKQAQQKIKEDRKNGVPIDPLRKRMAYSNPTIILSDSDRGTETHCEPCQTHKRTQPTAADRKAARKFLQIKQEQAEAALENPEPNDSSSDAFDVSAWLDSQASPGRDPSRGSDDPDDILFGKLFSDSSV